MSGIAKENKEERIDRDRKNTLNNKNPKKSVQRVFTGSARRSIEMFLEGNRDNLIKVDVLL